MNRGFFKALKFFTALALFACFIGNSWLIFHHYIMRKTVTSSNRVINKVGMQRIPAIVICRENAFSDMKKSMSTLEDYLNNTLELNYWITGPDGEYLTPNMTTFKLEYIYSFTRGRCVVLKYETKVR